MKSSLEKDHGGQIIDLTKFDFNRAPIYKSKPMPYPAYQLEKDEVIKRSWGIQDMKKGDWVVLKPSSSGGMKKSGVRKKAFENTYVADNKEGFYRKESFVRAMKIDHQFKFMGIDSNEFEQAPAGSYIVLNLDKKKRPIQVRERRDIYFLTQRDIDINYESI